MAKRKFQNDPERPKLIKQVNSLLKANWQALTVFQYLRDRVDKKNDPLLKMAPKYQFSCHAAEVVGRGGKLVDAFEGWVNETELVILKTGEETGRYEDAFEQCMSLNSDIASIRSVIKKSMIMPLFASILVLSVFIGARQKMFPMLMELVPMEKWKQFSLDFYDLTEKIGGNPSLTVGIVIGTILTVSWSIPNLQIKQVPQLRQALDRLPPYSFYKQIQISIFLRSLSTLITSGVSFRDSMNLIQENSNPYMRVHMDEFVAKVEMASNDSTVFEGYFLGDYGEDLSAMAKGDNLEGALIDVADECMGKVMEVVPARLKLFGMLLMMSGICLVIFGTLAFQDVISVLQSGE